MLEKIVVPKNELSGPVQPEEERRGETDELTAEEKKEIDQALETENVFELHPCLNSKHLSDEALQKGIAAQQKILSFGSRGLKYLKEKMIDSNAYLFALFATNMADESSFEVIADALTQDKVTRNHDGSAASQLSGIIQPLVFDIRQKNPNDPRLMAVARKIVEILENVASLGFIRGCYLGTLALTGTTLAKDYFANKPELEADYSDISTPPYRRSKHEFHTWEDVLRYREELSRPYHGPDHFADYRDRDYFPDIMSDYRGYSSRDFDSEYDDQHSSDFLDSRNFSLNEQDAELAREAEKIVHELDLNETVVSIAKLYIFNQLRIDPDKTKMNEVLNKIKNMAEVEKEYENNQLLPTIGIKIECHQFMLNPAKIAALRALMIPNESEIDDLWEVNPDFSYSSLIQSRYLQELVKMGAIKVEKKDDGKSFIPERHLLSLHVNLSTPYNKEDLKKYEEKIYLLSDALNYAFTSSERICGRKTVESVKYKDATESKKSQDQKELFASKAGKKRKKEKEKDSNRSEFVRLELRASEFRDYKTYLMLEGAQRIGAALFSYIKSVDKKEVNEQELKLARLWRSFEKDYLEVMKKNQIRATNLVDKYPYQAAELAGKTALKEDCRKVVYQYARRVGEVLDIRRQLPTATEA